MRTRPAAEVAELIRAGGTGCTLVGDPETAVGPEVVIDSRQATPGALFVALPGANTDGHDFLDAAAAKGASAAITAREVPDAPLVQLVCPDALDGLTALGRSLHAEARAAGLRSVALTGSAGKTSTKDLIAQVLATAGATVSPVGSFNNEIGTPLTVCGIDDQSRYLVSEMGARAAGDISHLTSIVVPDVAVVLNVGTAHIGEFGGRPQIAQAKGELVEAVDADGWAVLNADDKLVAAMASRTRAHIALFTVGGNHTGAAELVVRAHDLAADDLDRFAFTLTVTDAEGRENSARVQLRQIGRHQVANAAAAAAAALVLGLSLDQVAAALAQATSRSPWRMELHELANGAAVINDAYNANPDSMAAALGALAAIGERRRARVPGARAIAVLGDMLELGPTAADLHFQVGELAADLGIDEVVAIGEFAADLAAGAAHGGGRSRVVAADQAADSLELSGGDVVLVKASRGLQLERVADRLVGSEVEA